MKKLTKILGVALTFVLATSLIIMVTPAMADEEEWAAFDVPDEADAESISDGFMQDAIDGLGPFVQASDGTLYLYISGGVFDDLYLSDDWGRTWEATDWDDETGGDIPVDIWPSSDDSEILYAVSDDTVWKTDDEGDSWSNLGDPRTTPATEDLTCITVGYAGGDPHVFVGSMDAAAPYGEVYYFNDSAFASTWTSLDVGVGSDNDCNVYGIAVSPYFDDDTAVVALINDEVAGQAYTATNEGAKVGAINWDTAELSDYLNVDQPITGGTDPVFVEDFEIDDNYELFVGVQGAFNDTGLGGVFRMTGTGDTDDFLLPDVDHDIFSLDMVGEMGSTSLIAGSTTATGPASVWYSTNDGDDWDESDTHPSSIDGAPANALVIADEDFADSGEALCASDTANEGGVHASSDFGATWQGISALGTDMDGGVYDVTFTMGFGEGDTPMFMITGEDSLWRYDSSNWERMLFNSADDLNLVEASPFFSDDNTLFMADPDGPEIWRSTDGGATWDDLTRNPDSTFGAWLVIDDETLFTCDDGSGNIYKTTRYGRRVWDEIDVGGGAITDLAKSPEYASDGTLLAGDEEGLVFISTDEGEEWDELGDGDIADDAGFLHDTFVIFDSRYPDTPFVYAGSADVIERCEIDTADDWGDHEWSEFTVPDLHVAGDGISGIVCSDDGMQLGTHEATLYVLDASTTDIPAAAPWDWYGGLRRCLNPADDDVDDATFETVLAGLTDGDEEFMPMVGTDRNLHLTYGSNILYAIDYDSELLYTYEDTLAAPVVLSSPSDSAGIDSTSAVTLEWENLNSDTVDLYEVQINVDEDFPSSSDQGIPDEADAEYVWNSYSPGVGDVPAAGEEYFWRIRVHEGQPVLSRWSAEWQFQMKVGAPGAPVSVRPLPGEQDIVLIPSFSWASIDGADLYEFEMATDADFTNVVTSGTAEGPVFVSDVELDYGTTYYWRVRGLAFSGAPQGDWNVSVFTTMMEPEEAPPPVVIEEGTPPADLPDIILTVPTAETPVYVWIIIAIGALLVVAMVVLIIRTRAQPR